MEWQVDFPNSEAVGQELCRNDSPWFAKSPSQLPVGVCLFLIENIPMTATSSTVFFFVFFY